MNKRFSHVSILLAGLIAVAGAQAQSVSASGTSNLPPKAGEASTMTHGQPNMRPSNEAASEAPPVSKAEIRQEAKGRDTASATTSVPGRAGEATTMVRGQPNELIDPSERTRAEVRGEMMQQGQADDAARQQTRGMGYGTGYGTVTNQGTPK